MTKNEVINTIKNVNALKSKYTDIKGQVDSCHGAVINLTLMIYLIIILMI